MKQPSPWEFLTEMFKLGAIPIGYANGTFTIYCPPCAAKKPRQAKAAV